MGVGVQYNEAVEAVKGSLEVVPVAVVRGSGV